jgi:hypothetical protein
MTENLNNSIELISKQIETPYAENTISEINNQRLLNSQTKSINDEEDYSKKSRIKKRLKEILSDSTIHALPNIYKTDRILFKIMWFFFFLATFVTSIRLIVTSINDYLEYDTITQVDIGSEQPGNYKNFEIKKFLNFLIIMI